MIKKLLHRLPRGRARLVAAAALLGALLPAGVTQPAGAVTVTPGVNIRPCVDLNKGVCNPVGTTSSSGVIAQRCWRDGSWATGNYSSNRWILVYLSDGREGFVHSSFVQNQTSSPNCSTLAYVRAADKALSFVGQVYALGDIANKYSDWAPGPYGEWSGDCIKLVHAAYVFGAGIPYESGNAIDVYYKYRNRGLIHGGLPRYGAGVFYTINGVPQGHAAVYVGGRTVVTTQGLDNAYKPVVLRDIYATGNYLGWAKVG